MSHEARVPGMPLVLRLSEGRDINGSVKSAARSIVLILECNLHAVRIVLIAIHYQQ